MVCPVCTHILCFWHRLFHFLCHYHCIHLEWHCGIVAVWLKHSTPPRSGHCCPHFPAHLGTGHPTCHCFVPGYLMQTMGWQGRPSRDGLPARATCMSLVWRSKCICCWPHRQAFWRAYLWGRGAGQSGRRIKCVYIMYLNLKFLLQILRIIKSYFENSKFKSTFYNFEEVISTFQLSLVCVEHLQMLS